MGLKEFGLTVSNAGAKGLGSNVASGVGEVIGSGMSRLFGIDSYNDKRQLEQQQKLMEMQLAGNKQMADYGYGLEKKMFDYTSEYMSPQQQVARLEAAGLNPALMYGGAPGTMGTTGSQGGMGVSGGQAANAAQTEANNIARQGMALQLAMQGAQIENVKADTRLKEVNADVTGNEGRQKIAADINVANATIDKILAETTNEKFRNESIRLANKMQMMQNEVFEDTKEYMKEFKYQEMLRAINEVNEGYERIKQMRFQNEITEETMEAQKQAYILNLKDIVAGIVLKGAQAYKTTEEAKAVTDNLLIKWTELGFDETKMLGELYKLGYERFGVAKPIVEGIRSISKASQGKHDMPGFVPEQTIHQRGNSNFWQK